MLIKLLIPYVYTIIFILSFYIVSYIPTCYNLFVYRFSYRDFPIFIIILIEISENHDGYPIKAVKVIKHISLNI